MYELFDKIPGSLQDVAYDMYQITLPKFTDYHLVLAGFFVLRFVAPAVAAPRSFGLECTKSVQLSTDSKKRLLQVSKVIQAIANKTVFKESSHLDVLNENLVAANAQLREFFDKMIAKREDGKDSFEELKTPLTDESTMKSFWSFCIEYLPSLAKRASVSEYPAEKIVFGELIDCLSGLPMSGN
jgi:hypothetical protein